MDWKSTSVELTSSLLGARVIFATDEWFAIADNLLNPSPPTFDPNAYCSQGKVMDGWESRRRVSVVWKGRSEQHSVELSRKSVFPQTPPSPTSHLGHPCILTPGNVQVISHAHPNLPTTVSQREPGHDWAIVALPFPSTPLGLHIDTAFFTGNYVPRISIEGADLSELEGDGWIVGGEERKRKGGGVIGTAMTMEQGEDGCGGGRRSVMTGL